MVKKSPIILIVFLWASPAWGMEPAQKLHALQKNIAQVKKTIDDKTHIKKALMDSLQRDERSIAQLTQQLHSQHQDIQKKQAHLHLLKKNAARYRKKEQALQKTLNAQIQAAYFMKKPSFLTVLFRDEDRNQYHQIRTYEQYLITHCLRNVHLLQGLLNTLEQNKKAVTREESTLESLFHHSEAQRQLRTKDQKNRQKTLLQINHILANKKKYLETLLHDKKALERLMKRLNAQKMAQHHTQSFVGHMPLPISGIITHRFHDKIAHSDMKWHALLIRASEGTPVQAIAPGKVIFSDWMPRYGLLIIIDHGAGYMSLYAHNLQLMKTKDQWVTRGTVIAHVGSTGGQPYPALYFGIWHHGQPVDPQKWCMKPKKA